MTWIYFTFNARDKTVRTKVFLLILDSQSDFANDNLFRRICLAISIDVIGQGQDICFTKMQILDFKIMPNDMGNNICSDLLVHYK